MSSFPYKDSAGQALESNADLQEHRENESHTVILEQDVHLFVQFPRCDGFTEVIILADANLQPFAGERRILIYAKPRETFIRIKAVHPRRILNAEFLHTIYPNAGSTANDPNLLKKFVLGGLFLVIHLNNFIYNDGIPNLQQKVIDTLPFDALIKLFN